MSIQKYYQAWQVHIDSLAPACPIASKIFIFKFGLHLYIFQIYNFLKLLSVGTCSGYVMVLIIQYSLAVARSPLGLAFCFGCTKIEVFPKGYSEFHLLGPTDSSYKYHLEAFYIASEYKYNAHIMNCTHFLFQFSCFLNARFLRCRWLEESVTRLGDWLWLMKGSRTPGDWSKLSLHVNRGCVGM